MDSSLDLESLGTPVRIFSLDTTLQFDLIRFGWNQTQEAHSKTSLLYEAYIRLDKLFSLSRHKPSFQNGQEKVCEVERKIY